jgi:methenyltetrahydrofolate cyclohydrolase
MLVEKTVSQLLDAFSSPAPTPGGGSASALASATGISLLMMVASLPKTRTGADEERGVLAAVRQILTGIRDQLAAAIDADSAAYDQVVAAYKMPKGTPDEQQARKTAIQRGLRKATDVPLVVMRLSAAGLRESKAIEAHGHAGAASDVGVAVALLRAGLEGARLNVEINLGGLADAAYVAAVREEIGKLPHAAAV